MKQIYSLLLLFVASMCYSQSPTIPIKIDGIDYVLEANTSKIFKTDKAEIKSVVITYTLKTGYTLTINALNIPKNYTNRLSGKPFKFANDIIGKEVTLELKKNGTSEKKWSFTINKVAIKDGNTFSEGEKPRDDNPPKPKTFDELLAEMNLSNGNQFDITNGEITPFGYVDKYGRIHIYIDYRGNNLLASIPQGIADAQYIVHILSPKSIEPNAASYSIKQRSGGFNDALNFRNSDTKNFKLESNTIEGVLDQSFLLSTSTENINFDLVSVKEENNEFKRSTVESYTIKMTPTYQGSFDIGFVKTELANPTYSLINSPDGLTQTVKVTDNGESEGVATIMATFYYSPVVILESMFGKKTVPFYKLNGRNFLDDHKIYERFYPTVGVGLNDKVFENLFFGINWEVVRGFAIFYGWNYRKVNTFNMPNFEAGVTTVTQDQFDYYTNEKWLTKPAYGIKLDLLVVTGLFGKK